MLRVITSLFGPIFAKEMVETARRPRYYLSRVLYGLALLVALFVVWDSYGGRLRHGPGLAALAEMAAALFQAVSLVQYGAVFLFVPLFLCAAVAGEREERTLDLLFTTHLTDREIVLGKLASRVVVLVCLTLAGLPVLSLVMLFGGIDPEALVRVLAATLLAILYTGAHAVYFSAVTRSPLGALVRTYGCLAVWLVGVPLAALLLAEGVSFGPGRPLLLPCLAVLLFVNPVRPFVAGLEGGFYNQMDAYLGGWFFPLSFLVPTAWSLVLIGRAVRRLRAEPAPAAWLGRLLRGRRDPAGANAAALGWPGPGRPVLNPLWLRARVYDREGYLGRVQWLGWAAAALFLVLTLLINPRDIDDEECSMAFLAPAWGVLAALAALIAGTSLIGDRRRGFLDLVLVTPLSGPEVIDGTLLAVWHHLRRLAGLPWVLGAFFCLTGASLTLGVLLSLVTATLFVALVALAGVGCSLAGRTVSGALVSAFLLPLLALGGTLPALALEEAHGPVLWVAVVLILGASWAWVRRRPGAAAVGCYLSAVYLALAALCTFWTWDGRRDEYPLAAMHAGYVVLVTLDDHPSRWFRGGRHQWYTICPCYWAALVVSLVWARWWLVRNFDRLAGRLGERGTPPRTPAARPVG